jgi:hypothetical protein
MSLGTLFGQGGAITFEVNSTAHETNIVGFRENRESSGGQSFTTADGLTHKTPAISTAVSVEVTLTQDLTAANLWRYLRETTPTTGTIVITGSSSTTPSVSNPEITWTVTGWEAPPIEWSAGSVSTPTATIYVSGNGVVATS